MHKRKIYTDRTEYDAARTEYDAWSEYDMALDIIACNVSDMRSLLRLETPLARAIENATFVNKNGVSVNINDVLDFLVQMIDTADECVQANEPPLPVLMDDEYAQRVTNADCVSREAIEVVELFINDPSLLADAARKIRED